MTTRQIYRHRVAMLVAAAGLVAAGLSSWAPGADAAVRSSRWTKAQVEKTCLRVAAVLSDGPDPTVDPVGYALAQVRPLREIRTSDTALKRAIDDLAAAYEGVYKTGDKADTRAAVTRAGKKLDTICPRAYS